MAKAKSKIKNRRTSAYRDRISEADGVYLLKLVGVILLSTFWLKFAHPMSWHSVPLGGFPIGAMFVVIAIQLWEKHPIDRKIWYAVVFVMTIITYFVPAGIVI